MKVGLYIIGDEKVNITGSETEKELAAIFKRFPKLEKKVTGKEPKSDNNTKEPSANNKSKSKSNKSSK